MTRYPVSARMARKAGLCGLVAMAFSPAVWADAADLAPAPLETSLQAVVKPNVMLILDDSGSMDRDYMPDDRTSSGGRCFGYFGYNRIFYNPNVTYALPRKADGSEFPNISFTAAHADGFNPTSTTVDLSKLRNLSTPQLDRNDRDSKFYYSVYTKSGTPGCKDSDYSLVTQLNADAAKQNYANWYSYYRTRMLLMRTSVGQAFRLVDDKYRVGYTTISETGVSDGSQFLNVGDFDSTQKKAFFDKIYSANPSGWTPLRGALSKVGRYYANKASGQSYDPVQYSCQQNFSILSTDGYWNSNSETSSFGPLGLIGNKVGNVDALTADPASPPTPYNGRTSTRNVGPADTLADVAYYYYETDLRSPSLNNCSGSIANADVCADKVTGAANDTAPHQHMTTFTLGLGVDGTLPYIANYETAASGAYYDIKQGTNFWPNPIPREDGTRIDDLWHAAVNGRGKYFSASDPATLVKGLSDALSGITARVGASASAATSTLQPVQGNNAVYVAQYETVNWVGDLLAYTIDPTTGVVDTRSPVWSAKSLLNTALSGDGYTKRKVYFASKANNGSWSRQDFTYSKLDSAGFSGDFANACSRTAALSQCSATLTKTQQDLANSGTNLVNWLRGDASYESGTDPLYRARTARLGDIVNASPVYVGAPPFRYADTGYTSYKSSNKSRAPMIYAAANDGMLHAFNDQGVEQWAYVPRAVMPNLYKLADANYAANHVWSVDGSPVVADIATGNSNNPTWKSILVGGFNAGGRGYYALDITNPVDPKVLWEYTATDDSDLGLSFGNPIIGKLADGTWVVVFASGLNNGSQGDGNGHLYVLNANTGARLLKINTYTSGTTPAGSQTTPSGLAKINAWVDSEVDNTIKRVYGGDLLGNLWRFDIDNLVQPNQAALRLAQLNIGSTGQSITTKPELAELKVGGGSVPVVYVGTGRYLGTSDLTNYQQQAIYAIKDPLGSSGWGDVRTNTTAFKSRTLSDTTLVNVGAVRIANGAAVNFATDGGWYIDLPSSGERVNVDLQQQLGVLTVASNRPTTDACTAGGESWLYNLDIATGLSPNGALYSGVWLGNALTAGLRVVQLTDGRTRVIVTDATGKVSDRDGGGGGAASAAAVKRTSWRELVD